VQIWVRVSIENEVFIGPNVTFTNDLFPGSKSYHEIFLKTLIKKGASIGANTTIVAGDEIGENAIIGAGCIVTKNIPANTLWYRNPAKLKGFLNIDGTK
jgi:UDP-2-acetamido-3-amino-2,3-dideoxy-glucuronate N-acetyltransferase